MLGEDDHLYLAPNAGALFRVSSRGGDPQQLFEVAPGESDYHTPTALPDGRGILYTVHDENGRETVEVFAKGERKSLFRIPGARLEYTAWSEAGGSGSKGHLVYHRMNSNNGIWAVPFDLDRLELDGEAFILDPDGAFPSVGQDGSLLYALGSGGGTQQLVVVDRSGKIVRTVGQPQTGMIWPHLSPDGRYVLVSAQEADNRNIWAHDLVRQTHTRVSFGPEGDWWANWINDGRDVVYSNGSAQTNVTWIRPANGSHEPVRLLDGYHLTGPDSEGLVAFNRFQPVSGSDIFVQDLGSGGEPEPLIATPAAEAGPVLSPDGRFLVYMSNESAGNEVFLTSFPSGEGKWQVSTEGGAWPCWSRAGDAIIYRESSGAISRLLSVSFSADPRVELGTPEVILTSAEAPDLQFGMGFRAFAPTDNPDEFIMIKFNDSSGDRVARLVYSENWYGSYQGEFR